MIKPAKFESYWDDGILIATDCKVNTETKEVFDIEMVDAEGLDILIKEEVVVDNVSYPVYKEDEVPEGAFYYR